MVTTSSCFGQVLNLVDRKDFMREVKTVADTLASVRQQRASGNTEKGATSDKDNADDLQKLYNH